MIEKVRWPLAQADGVAGELVELIAPSCERIAVAGSIRRQREDVGDIELLCVPAVDAKALFSVDSLDALITKLIFDRVLDYRLNARGSRTYGPKNKLLVHVTSGIPVDIFSTDMKNWGMSLVVRTGPAEFNVKMMARFQAIGFKGHAYGGVTNRQGQEVDCPDEETVFRLLNWPYKEPWERK